jgi:hypothetical protein
MKVASATKVFLPSWSCFSLHPTCISTRHILETPLSQLVSIYHQYGTHNHRHRRVRSLVDQDLSLSLLPL